MKKNVSEAMISSSEQDLPKYEGGTESEFTKVEMNTKDAKALEVDIDELEAELKDNGGESVLNAIIEAMKQQADGDNYVKTVRPAPEDEIDKTIYETCMSCKNGTYEYSTKIPPPVSYVKSCEGC